MKSWQTSLVGFLTGLVLIINQVVNAVDTDPETVFAISQVLAGLGLMGIGACARDNNKSSEQVGTKQQ